MARKVIDCRDYPSESKCSLTLSGEEGELIRAATEHSVSVHGAKDSPELREKIRSSLKDEPEEWGRFVPKGRGNSAEHRVS